ncbi:hypothetical protein LTS16_002557 [Friedmanniomyces endolithicus]|nr:hypothetical protein LTR57_002546 [Friedmanniomyces endolithicus]KAK0979432.1 hypothetical protein LTS01_012400 [Friedmanniomyces endolithicus]KAK1051093.1 hypothetical protein LTS16_002557 [Friedmanniomyces endolithicus]
MQSSPPVRAWDRPSSPAGSQYSLDLGALGLESHDNESSPVATQRVDRVLSEDIDGPSDFTLNMAAWMRGGTMGKGTMRSARSGLRSLKEQEGQDDDQDGKHGEHLEVPQSPVQVEEDDTRAASNHTPDHSPSKDSQWHERPSFRGEPDASQDNDESDWDPYAPSGTPQPPVHKHFLQPTAEDYHSEFTPARLPSASAHAPSLRITTNTDPHSEPASPQQSRPDTPGRPSSETLSPARSPERSPVLQPSQPVEVSSPFTEAAGHRDLERQMLQLQGRCRQLDSLNSALKQALDEEQRIRKQEKAAHDYTVNETKKRERALSQLKEQADQRANRLEQTCGELTMRAASSLKQLDRQGQDIEQTERRHEDEVSKLRDELEAHIASSEPESQSMKHELELALRAKQASEQTARVHREELEKFRDSEAMETEQLRRELQHARTGLSDLELRMKDASDEVKGLRNEKAEVERAASKVGDELAAFRRAHDEQTVQSTADQHRAAEQSEDALKQMKDLQQQLRDEQTSHDDELEQLEIAHEQALGAAKNTVDTARNELERQQSQLNEAVLERDAAQDTLAELQAKQSTMDSDLQQSRSDLETAQADLATSHSHLATANADLTVLREHLADSEAVNAALDARVSDAMRKREVHWLSKLAESERERRAMAKALLHQWGREEVGVDEPQGYAYKYLARGPPKKEAAVS